jgi:hypothetical protein
MVGKDNIKIEYLGDEGTTLKLTITCVFCQVVQPPFTVTYKQWTDWHNATLITEAFAHLSDDERELLKSGLPFSYGASFP